MAWNGSNIVYQRVRTIYLYYYEVIPWQRGRRRRRRDSLLLKKNFSVLNDTKVKPRNIFRVTCSRSKWDESKTFQHLCRITTSEVQDMAILTIWASKITDHYQNCTNLMSMKWRSRKKIKRWFPGCSMFSYDPLEKTLSALWVKVIGSYHSVVLVAHSNIITSWSSFFFIEILPCWRTWITEGLRSFHGMTLKPMSRSFVLKGQYFCRGLWWCWRTPLGVMIADGASPNRASRPLPLLKCVRQRYPLIPRKDWPWNRNWAI